MAAISVGLLISFCLISGTETSYLSYKVPATSKSVYHYAYGPDMATDGDDYSVLGETCFHSGNGNQEWIKVDLQEEYPVTSVTIINRVAGGSTVHVRLEDAEVRIGSRSNEMKDEEKCGKYVTETQVVTSPIVDVICQQPISGRYVLLWFPSKNDFINICEIKVYAEHNPGIVLEDHFKPPAIQWLLNYKCLPQIAEIVTSECAIEIPQSINMTIAVDNNLLNDLQALTIAFYIYPYQNSMGNIIGFGNDEIRLRMEQTHSNVILYQSEVTVFYGDQQLTRAHVLLPEVWTFLALTFDGINKNIKLWRNGEIASIGYIEFTRIVSTGNIRIGGDDAEARVAVLKVYDRVLDESEMKAVRDVLYVNGIFEKVLSMERIHGKLLQRVVLRSPTQCARMCVTNDGCDMFGFGITDKLCSLYSTNILVATLTLESDMDFFRKKVIF